MTPIYILICFIIYTLMIFGVTYLTSRKSNNETYFRGNRSSPWFVVAYGMIGASLSGVTFMSVPGWVGATQFSYLMMVFGYFCGYIIIATVLLPLYYRLNLTSIYTYLESRFGFFSYKTGSFFFILSRTIGAAFRVYIVIYVLQKFVFNTWNVPFWVTVSIFMILILLYTFKGGVKTIVWTDTLQTTFMLISVIITIIIISSQLNFDFSGLITTIADSKYSTVLNTDWHSKSFFIKQFISGVFITITMTGLDQEMMQKNISCRNLQAAKKNMFTFSFIMILVNAVFLMLGAVLYIYASQKGISVDLNKTDDLFPIISINYLGPIAGLVFIVGLISACYPSADGALTALTTSFCYDILNLKENNKLSEKKKTNIRYLVHIGFAVILLLVVILFNTINDAAVIQNLFTAAGYTYGPLLGLYAFGLFTKTKVKDKYVPIICILSPIICFLLYIYSKELLWGYKFGFEVLVLNGLLTCLGLFIVSKRDNKTLI